MMRKVIPIVSALAAVLLAGYLIGCVDLPDTGPAPPDYKAQIRIMYLDPSLPTATVSMADAAIDAQGKTTFPSYRDLPAGAFGSVSAYVTYNAGAKKLLVKKADGTPADADTTTLTFNTDDRGTMLILPRTGTSARFLMIGERYIFASVGITDTAQVRFVNAIATFDTVNVVRLSGTANIQSVAATNLRSGRLSSIVQVAKDSVATFYLTRSTGSTAISDSITITGASHKQYTIVAYDSLANLKFQQFENQ